MLIQQLILRQKRFLINLVPQQIKKSIKSFLYPLPELSESTKLSVEEVKIKAQAIYGIEDNPGKRGWNYYSGALEPEVVNTYQSVVLALSSSFSSVNYLEIGSNQGVSMSIIALLLKEYGLLGNLISCDPYFETGYREGQGAPWKSEGNIQINKQTKKLAFELYKLLGINVQLLEIASQEGLTSLIKAGRKFELIYIDGSHEGLNPVIDFGLSYALLHSGGIIMLDDYQWEDVIALKLLCDQHCSKISECGKVAAYRIK